MSNELRKNMDKDRGNARGLHHANGPLKAGRLMTKNMLREAGNLEAEAG
jgi:hypothetical protein